jgi:hypothetical protein
MFITIIEDREKIFNYFVRKNMNPLNLQKYAETCETNGTICIPIISETFGKWSTTSISTLKRITKMIAQKNDKPMGQTFLNLIQRLSLAVQKSNGQMISCRIRPINANLF